MERLVTVRQMQERYGCSPATARKYIRQCDPHMERPLAATESAVDEWEKSRTVRKPRYTNYNKKKAKGERRVVPRRR